MNVAESGKKHNFSNPMYEAMSGAEPPSAPSELPAEPEPPHPAVLSPSSVLQRSSPTIQIRQKELSPTSDTGKDTQKLVEEDNSEC